MFEKYVISMHIQNLFGHFVDFLHEHIFNVSWSLLLMAFHFIAFNTVFDSKKDAYLIYGTVIVQSNGKLYLY